MLCPSKLPDGLLKREAKTKCFQKSATCKAIHPLFVETRMDYCVSCRSPVTASSVLRRLSNRALRLFETTACSMQATDELMLDRDKGGLPIEFDLQFPPMLKLKTD